LILVVSLPSTLGLLAILPVPLGIHFRFVPAFAPHPLDRVRILRPVAQRPWRQRGALPDAEVVLIESAFLCAGRLPPAAASSPIDGKTSSRIASAHLRESGKPATQRERTIISNWSCAGAPDHRGVLPDALPAEVRPGWSPSCGPAGKRLPWWPPTCKRWRIDLRASGSPAMPDGRCSRRWPMPGPPQRCSISSAGRWRERAVSTGERSLLSR